MDRTLRVIAIVPRRRSSAHESPDPPLPLARWRRRLVTLWQGFNPEVRGSYSLEKLLRTQQWRCGMTKMSLMLWIAPQLCVACQLLLEAIPLASPALGWQHQAAFYLRSSLQFLVTALCVNWQFAELTPALAMPWHRLLSMCLCQTVLSTGLLFAVSAVSDIFPLPLTTIVATPIIGAPGLFVNAWFMRPIFRRHPDGLKQQYTRLLATLRLPFITLILYSAYGLLFNYVDYQFQILLSLLLQVLKLWVKVQTWHIAHSLHPGQDDLAAEYVTCGSQFFHALFTAVCLQTSKSISTVAAVVGWNLVQDAMSIVYLRRISQAVEAQRRTDFPQYDRTALYSPALTSMWLHSNVPSSRTMSRTSSYFRHRLQPTEALAKDQSARTASSATSKSEVELMERVTRLFHVREVTLLRLYIDVIVPVAYLAYLGIMLRLPTRPYLLSLDDLNEHQIRVIAVKMGAAVAVKLVTTAVLLRVLHGYGQPSGLQQLGFVVDTQRWTMQTRFFIYTLAIFNFPLLHLGNDLSFQFECLRGRAG